LLPLLLLQEDEKTVRLVDIDWDPRVTSARP
jgi:hypothetical protein